MYRRALAAAAAVCMLLVSWPTVAHADDRSERAREAVESIGRKAPNKEAGALAAGSRFDRSSDSVRNGPRGSTVALTPAGAVLGVRSSHGGLELRGSVAGAGTTTPDGTLVFSEAGSGYSTVPVPHADGSIQVATVIESVAAPNQFGYTVATPNGGRVTLSLQDNGSVIILDPAGKYLGGVATPWAYDSDGRAVPTHYRITGSQLVQIVDHRDGHYQYPIVADPWLGQNLFSWITVDMYSGEPRVNLQPSLWGAAQWSAGAAGQAVMNTAGWDEAWNWSSTVRSGLDKPSQRQQFECHALGAPFAGVWNLEKFRPNRTAHWFYGVAIHHCNWTTAYRY